MNAATANIILNGSLDEAITLVDEFLFKNRELFPTDIYSALAGFVLLLHQLIQSNPEVVENALITTQMHGSNFPHHLFPPCDEVRYLTDDRDEETRHELVIQHGGNGDWYVSVVPEGHKPFGQGVRLCTSGGASSAAPGLTAAIANAFRAIAKARHT